MLLERYVGIPNHIVNQYRERVHLDRSRKIRSDEQIRHIIGGGFRHSVLPKKMVKGNEYNLLVCFEGPRTKEKFWIQYLTVRVGAN